MWDDPQFAALVERFRERAADEAQGIRAALADGNAAEVRALAHSLAGAAGTFGFAAISELARPLDEAAGAGAEMTVLERLATPLLEAVDALAQSR